MKREYKLGNKLIGTYDDEKKVFHKEVRESKHLFRKANAWGLDYNTLEILPDETRIEIHDKEKNITYGTTKERYMDSGTILHFKGEKDFGVQMFLPKAYFVATLN